MFGYLEHSVDYQNVIRSLDLLMPVLVIAAVAPSYMCQIVMASAIVLPGGWKAVGVIDALSAKAKAATRNRLQDLEGGMTRRNDTLQQLIDICHEKGAKANFGTDEVTLEGYTAL